MADIRGIRIVLVVVGCCTAMFNSGRLYAQDPAFTFESLIQIAQQKAQIPFDGSGVELPEQLKALSYDQYRDIRFDSEKALWRDEALFEAQFFHPGFIYRHRTTVNTLDSASHTQLFPYAMSNFIFGKRASKLNIDSSTTLGYAGFRIHYPLNNAQYKDEVAVFQGASYFRLVGPGQAYGLSARGLAIDTAVSSGEEFPRFTEFWLKKPAATDIKIQFYALLDSASVTGAYRFELSPGASTELLVTARLFARKDINKLGIAPLTSMYFFGENTVLKKDDYRPEVHDSDGLLIETAHGEWIWRPLNNPNRLSVVSFQGHAPKGFGLMQRDRDFNHYLDVEANYHLRPSLWVKPLGDWGEGRIELVEIPTGSETNDNIVAYWVPSKQIRKGDVIDVKYALQTYNRGPEESGLATVVRTRNGWAHTPGKRLPPKTKRQFVVDFAGEALASIPAGQLIEADLSMSAGKVSDLAVEKLPNSEMWRASFKIRTAEDKTADMRLFLKLRGQRISEVWSYVWNPSDISQ